MGRLYQSLPALESLNQHDRLRKYCSQSYGFGYKDKNGALQDKNQQKEVKELTLKLQTGFQTYGQS